MRNPLRRRKLDSLYRTSTSRVFVQEEVGLPEGYELPSAALLPAKGSGDVMVRTLAKNLYTISYNDGTVWAEVTATREWLERSQDPGRQLVLMLDKKIMRIRNGV